MSYSKTMSVKVIRTRHKISFLIGTSKEALIEMLNHVPSHATVDEVIECGENGMASVEFHEEIVEK